MADSKKTRRDDADGRQAALNAVMDQVEKQFGKGSLMRLGDRPMANIETISTGSLSWTSHLASADFRAEEL